MNALRSILLATSTLLALSCNSGGNKSAANGNNDTSLAVKANPVTNLEVQPINGYFVKNNIKITDSLTFLVINNRQSFDSLFGVAKTMSNTIDNPDFGTQLVIAVTMPATFYGTQIQLQSATNNSNNNNAALHFVAKGQPEKNSFSITPLWLGAVPKSGKSSISLYTGDHLTKTVTEKE